MSALLALLLAVSRIDMAVDALRNDSSLKVRTQAAIILGQQKEAPREAVQALRKALAEDDSAAVRIAAASALGKLHARAARSVLAASREADPEDAVRAAAGRSLDALGPVTVSIEEPKGPPASRGSLEGQLKALGIEVSGSGEVRLKPTVKVDVAGSGGRTVISVKTSLAVIDGDGHLDLLEGDAKAAVAGVLPEERLAGTSLKVMDAAFKGVCQDLAAKLGRR